MMVMPGNDTGGLVHWLAGRHPGKIGLLNTPRSFKPVPFYLEWALDNGCFKQWEPELFLKALMKTRTMKSPLFVVVPDVVGDAEATLKQWHKWAKKVVAFGVPLAFACQDGLEPQDVPKEPVRPAYCFIGGTVEWKLANAHKFKGVCTFLHVGRVSTGARLWWAEEIGADSVDGTGFFREGINNPRNKRLNEFIGYFEGSPQPSLFN